MLPRQEPFSKRNQYRGAAKEITVREAAPENLRAVVVQTALDLGWAPSFLRRTVCSVLHVRPDPDSWSEYPNIEDEVRRLVDGCEWFRVYDVIEAIYARVSRERHSDAVQYERSINEYFVEAGIGWQLMDGQIITRGTETFEAVVNDATSALKEADRPTAAQHLHDALHGLSRRPTPDLSGAIYHAMGSLECLARDLVGTPKATLGEILKRRPDLLPKPLDSALSQIWGYASNEARHVQEGRDPEREEAELVVGLCAAVSTYLSRMHK